MAASSASILSRIECTGSCLRIAAEENDNSDDLLACFVDESSYSPLDASSKGRERTCDDKAVSFAVLLPDHETRLSPFRQHADTPKKSIRVTIRPYTHTNACTHIHIHGYTGKHSDL